MDNGKHKIGGVHVRSPGFDGTGPRLKKGVRAESACRENNTVAQDSHSGAWMMGRVALALAPDRRFAKR
jgi:hypothetical protein